MYITRRTAVSHVGLWCGDVIMLSNGRCLVVFVSCQHATWRHHRRQQVLLPSTTRQWRVWVLPNQSLSLKTTSRAETNSAHIKAINSIPLRCNNCNVWLFVLLSRPVDRGEGNRVSYPGPRGVWEALASLKNIKYTRKRYFKKIQKFSAQRNPAIVFPQAPLWLSTGLLLSVYRLDKKVAPAFSVLSFFSCYMCYICIFTNWLQTTDDALGICAQQAAYCRCSRSDKDIYRHINTTRQHVFVCAYSQVQVKI